MKLGFFGPMKTLDSAKTRLEELPDGRLRATIEHETMQGVTPEMLVWWFENSDGFTTWNGTDFSGTPVPVYRYWHPYDHIKTRWVKPVKRANGHLAPGSVLEIQENIGGVHEVRIRARVTRFDDRAFDFELALGGILRAGVLEHRYAPVDGGSSFTTCLCVGSTLPVVGPWLTRLVRKLRISEPMVRDWLLHNVEESGETEKFVPTLFAEAGRRAT